MNELPIDFTEQMRGLLDENEYKAFLQSANEESFRGLRINTLKCTAEKVCRFLPFLTERSPFCSESYYLPQSVKSIGDSPFHHAGAFYVQEPSASAAVSILDVQPDDKVLDLCAAPGGKSTQIAAALSSTGLLWCNEIVKSRAMILLSNVERMGVSNAVVSSCHPDILCNSLYGFFDKVLVDAPCSGEGMFRKDPAAIAEWSSEHSRSCAVRQTAVLGSACKALKDGGTLVYSTCTFSAYENENVITAFLERHPEFELADCGVSFGKRALQKAVRILPQHGGEGHFVAKLIKKGALINDTEYINGNNSVFPEKNIAFSLYDEIYKERIFGEVLAKTGDKILLLPKVQLPPLSGLGVIRAGLLLGEVKKNRIEPCHALFMAGRKEYLNNYVDFGYDSDTIRQYLHGEEIEIGGNVKGYTAVLCEGISTGFGKASGGVLKNRYPKGLRSK